MRHVIFLKHDTRLGFDNLSSLKAILFHNHKNTRYLSFSVSCPFKGFLEVNGREKKSIIQLWLRSFRPVLFVICIGTFRIPEKQV